ncbi:MAG: tetratricopeptide repeat protein, partial [Candidatus Aminicenantes bacterium]|nr:tetratricopeptide repeat protein [Candidatus Aminicenantes bacterium]
KQYWQEAVRLQPDLWPALRNLSIADIRTGLYLKQAFLALDKALLLRPGEARLYYEWDILAEVVGISPAERKERLCSNHSVVQKRDDALTREILLLIQTGDYDTAIGIMDEHHFHVWEGGGQIHNVYVDAYLLMGLERMNKGDYSGALDSFRKALEYPENLEVARPEHGGRAPQVHFLIGSALEALNQKDLAVEHFQKALERKVSGSSLNYYQGMALKAAGRTRDAEHMFEGLVAAAQQRLNADSPDYFAKFGEKEREEKRQAEIHYLLGLGYLGLERTDDAVREFKQTLKLNSGHVWAARMIHELKKT